MSNHALKSDREKLIFLQVANLLSRPVVDHHGKRELAELLEIESIHFPLPFLPPLGPVYDLFMHHCSLLNIEFDGLYRDVPDSLRNQEARLKRWFCRRRVYLDLLGKIETENIPYMMMKGAVLENYYPTAFLRSATDWDIVIPQEYAGEFLRLALKSGWKNSSVKGISSLLHPETGGLFDVHTWRKPFARQIFEERVLKEESGFSYPVASPRYQYLLTTLHNHDNPSKKVWRDLADLRALEKAGISRENDRKIRSRLMGENLAFLNSFEGWKEDLEAGNSAHLPEYLAESESLFTQLSMLKFSPLLFEFYQPVRRIPMSLFFPGVACKLAEQFRRVMSGKKGSAGQDYWYQLYRPNLNRPIDFRQIESILRAGCFSKPVKSLFVPVEFQVG